MWIRCVVLVLSTVLVFVQAQSYFEELPETTTAAILAEGEIKISEYLLKVLKHFQSPDPVGLPDAEFMDPMQVPDTSKYVGIVNMKFQNTAVHGLSKFRILNVNVNIGTMMATANISVDHIEAKGLCVAGSWFTATRSPFSVKIEGLSCTALASLGVSREGKLVAEDIAMDISFRSISMNFEDAGAFGFIVSSFVNTAGNFLFDSVKPLILKEAYTKGREGINQKLDEVAGDMQFPNSISPLDMVLIDARKKVRSMNMDPYKIDDYNSTMGIFTIGVTNIWLTGISSFKRVGNISLALINNTVVADFEIGTQQLEGTTQWKVSAINGMVSKEGTACFSVKYINGRFILAQPVDTTKKLQFRDLDLEVGNIQVRFDGAGTIDYVIEAIVNILPNLLRYQIVEVLEGPIRTKLQQELNELDVEEAIRQGLPKLDEFQKRGFKLSEIRVPEEETTDDEFFNF